MPFDIDSFFSQRGKVCIDCIGPKNVPITTDSYRFQSFQRWRLDKSRKEHVSLSLTEVLVVALKRLKALLARQQSAEKVDSAIPAEPRVIKIDAELGELTEI